MRNRRIPGVDHLQRPRPGKVDRNVIHNTSGSGREDDNAVGEEDGFLDAVRDEDHSLPAGHPERLQLDLEFVLGHCIECGKGLIHQQDLRIVHQRTGDADTLLHAAGKLAWILVLKAVQADHMQELCRALLNLPSVGPADIRCHGHILTDCPPG